MKDKDSTELECFEGLNRLGLLSDDGYEHLKELRKGEKKNGIRYVFKCKKNII